MGDEHAAVHDDHVTWSGRESGRQAEEGSEERGETEVDPGGDGDLAEQVEPSGEPAPCPGVARRQLGGPVVEPARRRVAGADLCHPEPDDGGHDTDDDPAPHHVHGLAGRHAVAVEGEAPGEDRDDGEGHGEVGEATHAALELLGVAEGVERGLVISPYAKKDFIDHQTLSSDAYLKSIEDDFLGGSRLNPKTDGRPDPRPDVREDEPILGNMTNDFDFNQARRAPVLLPTNPPTDSPSIPAYFTGKAPCQGCTTPPTATSNTTTNARR